MPGNGYEPAVSGLARTHVDDVDLGAAYAEMAADGARETEALEWSEGLARDFRGRTGHPEMTGRL